VHMGKQMIKAACVEEVEDGCGEGRTHL
jgi:hypothetical protein